MHLNAEHKFLKSKMECKTIKDVTFVMLLISIINMLWFKYVITDLYNMETNSSISQCQECYLYGWTSERKHMNVIKVEHSTYFLCHTFEYMIERAVKYIYSSLFRLTAWDYMETRKYYYSFKLQDVNVQGSINYFHLNPLKLFLKYTVR